ncbi:hypothetical protein BDR04DRAFT_1032442 [Suillus decipiens]|nr:hypothetical protein BDR04DRAFT_1032442 [Suillus decipiens]
MNTISTSTRFSLFQLHLGHLSHMLPPLLCNHSSTNTKETCVHALLSQLTFNFMEAQDNLLAAKAAQASCINKGHTPEITLQVNNCIMLATKHH